MKKVTRSVIVSNRFKDDDGDNNDDNVQKEERTRFKSLFKWNENKNQGIEMLLNAQKRCHTIE